MNLRNMFSRFSGKLISLTLLVLMPAVSGCFYIPPHGSQFAEEKRNEIVVGKTTNDQVIELLGEPNILKDRRFFICEAQRSHGTILFIGAAGYSGGIFPVPIKKQHFLVLLCFDDQNIVNRYEVESAKERLFEGSIPENLGKGGDRLNGELLLKGKDKDLLGIETGIGFNFLAVSADGRIMGAAGFKLVGGLLSSKKVWMKNLVTGELRVIDTCAYDHAVFSPDLTRVALLKRTATILDTTTGKPLLVYGGHGDSSFWRLRGASCLAFDQTGRFVASGGYQGNISIWDSRTGEERFSIKGHDKHVLSVAWTPDGRFLATASLDGFVKMWRATTGEEVFKRKQEAETLSFSPDGTVLAINRCSHIELWRMKYNSNNDRQEPKMELYNAFLLPYLNIGWSEKSLAWSLDGRFLAAGNGSVVVYGIEKEEKVMRLIPAGQFLHPTDSNNAAHTMVFTPDGKSIFAGTNQGVYRYPLLAEQE